MVRAAAVAPGVGDVDPAGWLDRLEDLFGRVLARAFVRREPRLRAWWYLPAGSPGQPSPALVAVAPPASSPRPALPLPAATAAAVSAANPSSRARRSAPWRMRAACSAPKSLVFAPALLLFGPCNPAARARADA
jgi:hypothetical protein